ncbi:helix-turn-helix domain-containing protein [Mesorhizobium sp. M1050]|uniref:GlxA family transcriptional regulator n=1 Tax=Mesorhizobium sp. M1050 TaxID=2957051 RepID=UPI003334EA62
MAEDIRPITVALLAVPEVTASTLFGMVDLLSSAGRDWGFLTRGEAGAQRMQTRVVARQSEGFRASNNVWIRPDCMLDECPDPDIVCIPDFFVTPGSGIGGLFGPEVEWLKRCHQRGALMASACSGALLLAEAGLLDGLEATIHWGYIRSLSDYYPKVRVNAARVLITEGAGHRIILAGGGTSWQDLALVLIARFVGLKQAMEVARIYLVTWHDFGQLPFAALTSSPAAEDALVRKSQQWIADNYSVRSPVAKMAEVSGLPERSFIRRFRKATGYTPIKYVHTLRLEEAKQHLETGALPLEAVSSEIGYEDASFFSRLFRRSVGMTPAAYRRRFGGLRKAIAKSSL